MTLAAPSSQGFDEINKINMFLRTIISLAKDAAFLKKNT